MVKKILVVEDDATLLEALKEWLVDEGYEVAVSSSVEDSFEKMNEQKPDLILTDLVMAGMTGFDILQHIQDNIHLNGIPVVIMSNSAQEGDEEKARSMGAREFMIKSDLSLKEIVDRVKVVLEDQVT